MTRGVGESQRGMERSRECYRGPWSMEKTSESLRGPERGGRDQGGGGEGQGGEWKSGRGREARKS